MAGGQLFTEDGPWASDTVTNNYTKRLRTGLGLVQPTGYWTNGYQYDLAQRLTNIASVSGNFSYAYDASAASASPRVRKLTLPNSAYITNHHDSAGRLLFTRLLTSGGTITNKHEYSYNAGSQRTNHLRHDDSYVRFAYDGVGQLKSGMATNSSGSPLTSEHRGYAYDAAFNLCDRTNGTTPQTFIVNGKNEMTNCAATTCKYDANGNMTNNGTVYYGYDDENRLAEAWKTSGINPATWWWTVYVYDGQSRLRMAREYRFEQDPPEGPEGEGPGSEGGTWVLNTEARYVYDGTLVIQERDMNNTPTVTYTRGNDLSGSREGAGGIGGLLARSHGYSSGNWSTHNYYHVDGNGNVTFLLANDQTLSARYVYDPYGRSVSSSGSLATANTYRFSSKEVHAKTGFSSYLYRWYAPEMQRWVSRDPIVETGFSNLMQLSGRHHVRKYWKQVMTSGSGVVKSLSDHTFVFVSNNPVSKQDALGLAEGCDFFPDKYETGCVLECCAEHDKCWRENNCGPKSWHPFRLACTPCGWCNLRATACIIACALVDDTGE